MHSWEYVAALVLAYITYVHAIIVVVSKDNLSIVAHEKHIPDGYFIPFDQHAMEISWYCVRSTTHTQDPKYYPKT